MPFCSKFTIFKQIFFENSDRAAYSDLNPVDRGQSPYLMGTVLWSRNKISWWVLSKVAFGIHSAPHPLKKEKKCFFV